MLKWKDFFTLLFYGYDYFILVFLPEKNIILKNAVGPHYINKYFKNLKKYFWINEMYIPDIIENFWIDYKLG